MNDESEEYPIERPTVVVDWLNELGLTIDDLDRGSTNTYAAWIRADTAGDMVFDLSTKRGDKARFRGIDGNWTRIETIAEITQPVNRDTQFAGFALLLMQEIDEHLGAVTEWALENDADEASIRRELASRWQKTIAQRAYDLVGHTFQNTGPMMLDCYSHEEQIAAIPDMPTFPEEAKE